VGLGRRLFGDYALANLTAVKATHPESTRTLRRPPTLDVPWLSCFPIFDPRRRQPQPRALWDPQQPFCYRRANATGAPLDGTCSAEPSNATRIGLLRGGVGPVWEWPFSPSRTSPNLFALPPRRRGGTTGGSGGSVNRGGSGGSGAPEWRWLDSRSPLPGYRSKCWKVGGTVRCLPLWVAVGLHKTGTTSLFNMFHGAAEPTRKESKFWAVDRGLQCAFPRLECYMKQLRPDEWFGDATVPLTAHLHAPLFLHQLMPRPKLIATLRESLDLLESRYFVSFFPMGPRAFGAALLEQVAMLVDCQTQSTWRRRVGWGWDPACAYTLDLWALRDVLYADSLHPWLARFRAEDFLFISMHSLTTHPERVARFLGLPGQAELRDYAANVPNAMNNNSRHAAGALWESIPHVRELLQVLVRPMHELVAQMADQDVARLFRTPGAGLPAETT